jgi:membrane protease YdiL (CAAX protease family)
MNEEKILTDKEIRRAVRKNTFPTWMDILSIVGVFFLSSLLMGAILLMVGIAQSGFGFFIGYLGQFVLTIAYTVFLVRKRTGKLGHVMHFSLRGFDPAVILWGLILMLALSVVIEPVINLFPAEWYDWVGDRLKQGGWMMATAVVVAPICEEVLFRGLIQGSLVRKRGPWVGIPIASALFGIIHIVPQQVVAGFLLGMVIGFVYYKTRSLLAAIVLHLINNALSAFLTLFEPDEGPSPTLRQMIGNQTVYWVIFAVSALLVILSLVQVIGMIRKSREASIENNK